MKEKLRESLDQAMMLQRLINVFRTGIRETLDDHPQLNDGLSLLMTTAHNGLGKIAVKLYAQIELLNERIEILGEEEGMEKQIKVDFAKDEEADDEDWGIEQ